MLSANNPDQLWYENLASLIHCVQPFRDFYHRTFINLYSYNNQIYLLEIYCGWRRCSIVILWITLSQNHFGQSHWAKTKKNNEMISRLNLSHTNLSLLYLWKQIIPITYKSKQIWFPLRSLRLRLLKTPWVVLASSVLVISKKCLW